MFHMAEDTLRQIAFQYALEVVDVCGDSFLRCDASETITEVFNLADEILVWLAAPEPAARLILNVGPVTEQL